MKMEARIVQRIVQNALLSLFLYALPVLLMFASFYATGQRPWEKKVKKINSASIKKITVP